MNRLWIRITLLFTVVLMTAITIPIVLVALFGSFDGPHSFDDNDHRHYEEYVEEKDPLVVDEQSADGRPQRGPRSIRNAWSIIPSIVLRLAFGIAILGALAGGIASFLISRPFSKMAEAANNIGSGDFDQRVEIKGPREITALATAFNGMVSDLQEAETLRSNLIADVSHELRTPLTILEGNLRAVLDGVYTLDETEVANLYGQTRVLTRLVEDLHLLSRAEAQQLSLNLGPLSIADILTETHANFEPLAADSDVAIKLSLPVKLADVYADRQRIHQILGNLVSNALRHTPAGGSITLAAQALEGQIEIRIIDTGSGIEPEHLPHLFDRFYRTDKSRSRETGGSGLGLAIVKAMLEAQNGTIRAHSDGQGTGTTICLTLPTA